MIIKDKIFESVDTSKVSRDELEQSKKLYTYLLESIDEAIDNDKTLDDVVDEGVLSGLVGAAAGSLIGPAIMKAVCSALGVERGVLYDLMTSKLILGSVGATLGLR